MKKLGVKPNVFTYNYIINCASCMEGNGKEKMESFKIAASTFQELCKCEYEETDSLTYTFFLKACGNLLPLSSTRTKIIKKCFEKCCKEGKVNDAIITMITHSLPFADARELLATKAQNLHTIRASDVEQDWSCNAKQKKKINMDRESAEWNL